MKILQLIKCLFKGKHDYVDYFENTSPSWFRFAKCSKCGIKTQDAYWIRGDKLNPAPRNTKA